MEFSAFLSRKQFKGVFLALIANNRKLHIFHTVCRVFLILWIAIPFLQVFIMGIQNQASLSQVFYAYTAFFVKEGWFSFYFLILCGAYLFSLPRVQAFFSFKKHYRNFEKLNSKKIVLSEWKVCVYSEENHLLSSFPYHEIEEILWDETVICLLMKSKIYFTLNCEYIPNESTVESIAEYLEQQKQIVCRPAQECSYSFACESETLWETTIPNQPHYLTQFYQLFSWVTLQNKTAAFFWAFLLVVFIVLIVLQFVPILSTCCAALAMWNLLFLRVPFLHIQHLRRFFEKNTETSESILFAKIRITKDGIERSNGFYYNFFRWSVLSSTVIGQNGLLIFQNGGIVAFIPKELFESEAQFLYIGRTIQTHIEQARLLETTGNIQHRI